MIKVEEECKDVYYCLNPSCYHQQEREFKSGHSHFNVPQCCKWIINFDDLMKCEPMPYNQKKIENLELHFDRQPLAALKKLENLKISDWKKWLSNEQNRMKKDISIAIETQFQAIRVRIDALLEHSSLLYDLRSLVCQHSDCSNLVNKYYEDKQIKLQQLSNGVLFKKFELKQRVRAIKNEIQKIYSCLMDDNRPGRQLLTHQQQRAFHEYIFQSVDNYYNKLQVIASSLGKKVSIYSIQNENISLQCLVCDRKMKSTINPTNKKAVKKYLAERILSHLYSEHYESVGFAFSRKIAKTHLSDLTFQQFLKESQCYDSIKIIDRQSGINSEETYEEWTNSPGTYRIQVISLNNSAMARGKHIFVGTSDSIGFIIAIISYVCTQRDQIIEIDSKKEALKSGIKELLDLKPRCKPNCPAIKKQQIEVKVKKQQ